MTPDSPLNATDPLTVSDYAARIQRAARAAGGGLIEGEVQRPRRTGGGSLMFDLTDGEWVELEITRRLPAKPANVISLKGIWSQHIQPTDEGDWVSDAIGQIRR